MTNIYSLKGKTIKKISKPGVIRIEGEDHYDENILIEFTDGSILKLASWDYQIKSMQRSIALRPLKRAYRLYAYEAGRTIIGGILFLGATGGMFIIAGII